MKGIGALVSHAGHTVAPGAGGSGGAGGRLGVVMELPHEDDLRWIVSTYAHLRAEHGEAIGTPELVEPTGEYFPDAFAPSPQGVAALIRRMLAYAPVADDIAIELAFAEAGESGGGGCGTAGCGTGRGGEAKAGPVAEALRTRTGWGTV